MAISSKKVRVNIALKKETWANIKRLAEENNTFGSTIIANDIEQKYGISDEHGRESAKSKK